MAPEHKPAKPVHEPAKSVDQPRLQHFRERYARVDSSVRGDAGDRASQHENTHQDWHPHRKKAAD
jgi:hypothetical protein